MTVGRSAAVQDRGDQGAKSDRKEPVVRHHSQELVQLTSGRFLHAVAHNAHAVQEHTETAQETEDTFQISDIHNVFSILFVAARSFASSGQNAAVFDFFRRIFSLCSIIS